MKEHDEATPHMNISDSTSTEDAPQRKGVVQQLNKHAQTIATAVIGIAITAGACAVWRIINGITSTMDTIGDGLTAAKDFVADRIEDVEELAEKAANKVAEMWNKAVPEIKEQVAKVESAIETEVNQRLQELENMMNSLANTGGEVEEDLEDIWDEIWSW
jgi:gas vesicle protein